MDITPESVFSFCKQWFGPAAGTVVGLILISIIFIPFIRSLFYERVLGFLSVIGLYHKGCDKTTLKQHHLFPLLDQLEQCYYPSGFSCSKRATLISDMGRCYAEVLGKSLKGLLDNDRLGLMTETEFSSQIELCFTNILIDWRKEACKLGIPQTVIDKVIMSGDMSQNTLGKIISDPAMSCWANSTQLDRVQAAMDFFAVSVKLMLTGMCSIVQHLNGEVTGMKYKNMSCKTCSNSSRCVYKHDDN